eukprot:COSAG04_NODE_1437_length_6768_cov_13.040936_4_plen_49_part_00
MSFVSLEDVRKQLTHLGYSNVPDALVCNRINTIAGKILPPLPPLPLQY